MAGDTNRDANGSRRCRHLARLRRWREPSVPAIALSRQSRRRRCARIEEPAVGPPRESGAIEQDADLVMFLWRDKERGQDDQEQDGEVINLKLAKHRNGPTGEIQLWFKKTQTRFVSYAGDRYAETA
jgi:replicative DNA helicase